MMFKWKLQSTDVLSKDRGDDRGPPNSAAKQPECRILDCAFFASIWMCQFHMKNIFTFSRLGVRTPLLALTPESRTGISINMRVPRSIKIMRYNIRNKLHDRNSNDEFLHLSMAEKFLIRFYTTYLPNDTETQQSAPFCLCSLLCDCLSVKRYSVKGSTENWSIRNGEDGKRSIKIEKNVHRR